jgi:class 3 adenylate cyclase/tetratricopeptide (TPR) repeat protein
MTGLGPWLQQLGLEQYADLFAIHGVDMEVLSGLTDRDLKELGLPLGPRRIILRTIAKSIEGSASGETILPRAAEIRQLTLLFCDLIGSTGLSVRLDPEDLRDVIGAYQQACSVPIKRFEGHVARYVGDGILVYFGYPVAHEDGAERAVRAGLEIVEAVAELNASLGREKQIDLSVRVGIATGVVVVGDLVTEGVVERDAVIGKAPNLAARLQSEAAPNTVVVSPLTKQLAGGLNYISLGERKLKGIDEQTTIWQVTGERIVSRLEARSAALTPFVNRDKEIKILLKRWECAKLGDGQAVLLSGEPGIGKSRIAAEASDRISAMERQSGAAPPTVLCLQCSPYHSNTSLYPVIRQLEQLAAIDGRESAESKLAKLKTLLKHSGVNDGEKLSLMAELCGFEVDERGRAPEVSPRERRHRTLDALKSWCTSLAADRPLLLIFEDLQWIDPTSKLLLDQLVVWAKAAPALIIATQRIDGLNEQAGRNSSQFLTPSDAPPHVTQCKVRPLTPEETLELITAASIGSSLPQKVMEVVQQRSEHIPLFAEELTMGLLEAEKLSNPDREREWATSLAIPSTINDALMARVDQMGGSKEIAQQAAVIGREFSLSLLSKISGMSDDNLLGHLQGLERSDVITASETTRGTYSFRHTLIRDAAYRSLLRKTRREIHLMIATELELCGADYVETSDELIAQHYSHAGARKEAIECWYRAAKRAIARSAHEEAGNMLEHAFREFKEFGSSASPALELDLTLALATALRSLRGYGAPEVEARLLRARELMAQGGDATSRFNVEWELFQCRIVRGDIDRALEIAGGLFDHASQHPHRPLVDAYLANGMAKFHLGDFEGANTFFGQGVALTHPETDQPHYFTHGQNPGCFCLSYLAHTQCFLGYPDQARATIGRSLSIARRRGFEPGHLYSYVNVLTFAVRVHQFLGEVLEVKHLAEELIGICCRNHYAYYEALGTVHLGWGIGAVDSISLGIEKMCAGLAGLEKTGTMLALPGFYLLLAQLHARNGNFDGAREALHKAAGGEGRGTRIWFAEVERIRGVILASGSYPDLDAAEAAYRSSLHVARHQKARSLELRTAVSYARLLERLGRRQEGHDLLKGCLAQVIEGKTTEDVHAALAAIEALADEPPST